MATLHRPHHQRSVAIRPRSLRPRAGHVDTYATSRLLAARHALLRDPLRERRPPPSLLALLPLPPPPSRTTLATSPPRRASARAASRCPLCRPYVRLDARTHPPPLRQRQRPPRPTHTQKRSRTSTRSSPASG